MKLKQFLDTCSSNVIHIDVFDAHDNLLYEGMLYLIFHLDDRNIENEEHNTAYFTLEERDAILSSNVQVWFLQNDNSVSIGIDYEK